VTGRPNVSSLPSRPNILVLLLDDQDDFTPYWEAMPKTAAMVKNGLRFRNAFSPTPVCAPGRCTFLTGRLAHNTGVYTLSGPHGPANFVGQAATEFSVGLSQLGYINGYFGKTWGGTGPNPGWQRWCAISGNNMYTGYGYQVTDYSAGGGAAGYTSGQYVTDFLADKAVEFVQRGGSSGQPFLICLAPTAPHLPLPPAPRDGEYAKRRWGDRLPIRPNYNERDVRDKSRWLRDTAFVRSESVPYARDEYHKRMGSLMAVDDMMARIQSVLIAQGKWNNTIVFVTSDNGYNLGSHRLIHKMAPYEESIHVPLYVAGPGVASGEITKMVGLHDLGPTFLQLAGGQAPSSMDGKPLGAFLTSGSDSAAPDWRTVLLTEYDTGGDHPGFNPGGAMQVGWELDIPTYRSVRTATAKYIVWLATREEEVYDLVNDPYELRNLTRDDPIGVGPLRDQLSAMLIAVRGCSGGGCP
jgi:arylsulfatase A-like enzyme